MKNTQNRGSSQHDEVRASYVLMISFHFFLKFSCQNFANGIKNLSEFWSEKQMASANMSVNSKTLISEMNMIMYVLQFGCLMLTIISR